MIYDIHCPPLILAPLVNMSKGSCENKSVFFNNLYLSFTKLYPIIEVKQLKVGGGVSIVMRSHAFSSSCWHPNIAMIFSQGNSSECSPLMPEEFGEHLIKYPNTAHYKVSNRSSQV